MNYRIRKIIRIATVVVIIGVFCVVELIRSNFFNAQKGTGSELVFVESEIDKVEDSFPLDEVIHNGSKDQEISTEIHSEEEVYLEESEAISLFIHVSGAVRYPDRVYALPENARIEDAVLAAGGLLEDADLSEVNLAGKIADGMKIYIPRKGETASVIIQNDPDHSKNNSGYTSHFDGATEGKTPIESNINGLTNINTASIMELDSLPGIGPALAQRIIDYREVNGLFQNPEELILVRGIGEKMMEKLRDRITVE